jgi:flagellar biogenesis protein FliO
MVRVVDRIALDGRKSLCVIEIADKWMLIAVSESGVQLVSELDSKDAAAAEKAIAEAREADGGMFSGSELGGKVSDLLNRNKEQ